jgi:DNA-binding MarR family transcriptional regulator
MNNNYTPDEISLKLLDELMREPMVTQRALAARLGIALGLVNAYVKRLYKKGYIKGKNLSKKRIKYIITPKGFTEKARLTYPYLHRSINYFKDARQKIEQTYALMLAAGVKDVLLWGDGEIAELCYISTRGLPLKIVGVVSDKKINSEFFGYNFYSKEDIKYIDYDAILVASIENKIIENIKQSDVNSEKVYYLQT